MDVWVHRIQIAFQQLKQNMESDSLNRVGSVVTRPQMFMLYAIRKHGKCKLTQLAEQMEVKPSAITVMIDRLEHAEFVKRTHGTVDRRSVLVELTPLGKETLEKAIQELSEVEPSVPDSDFETAGTMHVTQNIAAGGKGNQAVNRGNRQDVTFGSKFEMQSGNMTFGTDFIKNN